MEQKNKASVEIFGEEYTMRGEAAPDYMTMLANYIDKKMKNIANRQPQLSVTKIAVLAALNIADELSKLQEDYDSLVKIVDGEKKEDKKEDKKTPSQNQTRGQNSGQGQKKTNYQQASR